MSLPDTPLSSWPPIPGSTGPETQPAAPHSGCDGAWPHSLVSVGLCHPQDSPLSLMADEERWSLLLPVLPVSCLRSYSTYGALTFLCLHPSS